MNTGAHDAGGGFTSSVGANAARGIAVIVAAVLVGLLLMQYGIDADTSVASADTTTSASTGDDSDTSGDDADGSDDNADGATGTTAADTSGDNGATTTDTTAAPVAETRDPSEVKVLVLNAAVNKAGIAGRGTEIVSAGNFVTLTPDNAIEDQDSVVLYAETFEESAAQVAELFGLNPADFTKPIDPDSLPIEDTQGADVIVIIGFDGAIDI